MTTVLDTLSAPLQEIDPFWPWGIIGLTMLALGMLYLVSPSRRPTYQRQHSLFTKTEWRFMRQLLEEFERDYLVMAKVRIADLLKVAPGRSRRNQFRAFVQISSKHIDFVLIDPTTGRIICAIELDDPSHQRKDRRQRDHFVNQAFHEANLPLVRVATRTTYDMARLREMIDRVGEASGSNGQGKMSGAQTV